MQSQIARSCTRSAHPFLLLGQPIVNGAQPVYDKAAAKQIGDNLGEVSQNHFIWRRVVLLRNDGLWSHNDRDFGKNSWYVRTW